MYCDECGNKMRFKHYETIPFSEYECGHCGWNMDDFEGEPIEIKPPEFILVPIGEYNGVDLDDITVGIPCEFFSGPDAPEIGYSDYIVWMEIPNPEYGEWPT